MKRYLSYLSLLIFIAVVILLGVRHISFKKELGNEINEEDGMQEAMAFEFTKTQDPSLHRIPSERLATASKQVDDFMQNLAPQYRTNTLSWNERGPNNIGGRTRAILVDKNDATGNTVFAGSVGGGLWKCTNFTASNYTWSKVNDNLDNLAFTCLAQDPTTPNIMYAGTGEGFFNADAIKGGGIFKSTDGGATWSIITTTIPGTASPNSNFSYVQDIIVTTDGYIYAATRGYYCNTGGILKSTNGGVAWTNVLGSGSGASCTGYFDYIGSDIEIAANGDLYCTTGLMGAAANSYSRIFKSAKSLGTSQGNVGQWTNITPTPPSGDAGFRRIELACAPSDNQFLYALCQNYNGSDLRSIYKSVNGGSSWTTVTLPTWCDQGSSSTDLTRGQAWYDLIAAIDPNTTNNIYIGGVDIMKSSDAGTTFSQLTQWAGGCYSLPNIHADNHNIVFINASSSKFIASNDGGIYYTADGGATFAAKNIGFNITQYYSLAMHPNITNYFLGGAQDNGTHKISSAGIGSGTQVSGGDGAFCHVAQSNPNIQLSSYVYQNIYISRNGGTNFNYSASGGSKGSFINPSDYDETAGILYMGDAANYVGKITNVISGTPTASSVALSSLGSRQISAVKVDVNAVNTVWIAGYSGSAAPSVLKLTNANATPTVAVNTIVGATSGAYISCIDVEKGNSNHVLVTLSNYGVTSVYESTDGGTSFTAIEGNLPDMPVRWGIFLPSGSNEGVIALATELGVFTTTTTNGASTVWVSNNSGFPKVRTDMLKYRYSDNTLAAATHGRGIFSTTLGITPVTWTGTTSDLWTTASNWSASRVPTITDEVIIPNVGTLPVISTPQSVNKLTINSGATLTISNDLQVAGHIVNNGNISGLGNVIIAGFSGQTISGSGTINNLTLKNDATILSGVNTLNITGLLSITTGTLTTNGNLVLKSNAAGTASIGQIFGTITGNVTVERYIPAGNRSFRFLTPIVTTTNYIKNNWQEGVNNTSLLYVNNQNPNTNYGTHITGSTTGLNGFDATLTGNPSFFQFDNITQNWNSGIANTNAINLVAGNAYRLLIRGNRSYDLNNTLTTNTATTLRATGTLLTGNITYGSTSSTPSTLPILASNANEFSFIGNPYASPIDWNALSKSELTNYYYYWDPTLGVRGAYVSCKNDGTKSNSSSNITTSIQPGQAFFVQNSSNIAARQLTITEANKITGNTNVFRPTSGTSTMSLQLFLTSNITSNGTSQDGLNVLFNSNYNNAVDDDDAAKFVNQDENIAVQRDNKLISIENRNLVPSTTDTVHLKVWQLTQNNYTIRVDCNNFQNGSFAYLQDTYLNTESLLNLSGITDINFSTNTNPASTSANRFMIVFRSNASLPIIFTQLKAYQKSTAVELNWDVQNDISLNSYEIEKSSDGILFIKSGQVQATGKSSYKWLDAYPIIGNNYYRLKFISKNGQVNYSQVVNVKIGGAKNIFTIVINPIAYKRIALQLENVDQGVYQLTLFSSIGQRVATKNIYSRGGSSTEIFEVSNLPVGIYQLNITGEKNIKITKSVIIP